MNHTKRPYELWRGRTLTIKYFRIFGRKCYIRRDEEDIEKFDARLDERILLGISSRSKAYQFYNKRINKIV